MRGWLRRILLERSRERLPAGSFSGADPAEAPRVPTGPGGPAQDSDDPAPLLAPVPYELGDTLDLHMFHPRDAAALVRDFLDAASLRGDRDLRIIHGKGIGVQRGIVRAILEGDPRVEWFGDSPDRSGWGATLVRLRGTAL